MEKTVNKELFVEKTREWFEKYAGYKSLEDARAVIGISGGKDSSVVAALLTEALGADHVFGVMMPNGIQSDIQDSKDLIEFLGIKSMEVNIGNPVDSLMFELDNYYGDDIPASNEFSDDSTVTTNLPARLRMTTLYAIANHLNGRVIGTGNKSEIVVGYYTLFGDGSNDFDPIADLYVDEVIELGRQLGLPEKFLLKTPNDGMSGMSDEEKLGFSYADVKTFYNNMASIAMKELGQEKFQKISQKHWNTMCKRNLTNIPYIDKCTGNIMNLHTHIG